MRNEGLMRLSRDLLGRLEHAQGGVRRANEKLAGRLAEYAADFVERDLERPGASSGRLAAAMRDPRNRYASPDGFGVGRYDFLDSMANRARYWRQIEEGSAVHRGQLLIGLWATEAGRSGSGRMKGLNAAGGLTPFGEGRKQQFVRMRYHDALAYLRRQGREAAPGMVLGRIRRGIQPHRYLARAWARLAISGDIEAVYTEVFREAGVPINFQAGLTPRRARAINRLLRIKARSR